MYKVNLKPNEYRDNVQYLTEEQLVFLLNEMENASHNLQDDEYENYNIRPLIDAVSKKLKETNAKDNLRQDMLTLVENRLTDTIFDKSTRSLETRLLLTAYEIKDDMKIIQVEKNLIKDHLERIINIKKRSVHDKISYTALHPI